jgi:lysophospholipase L1-like esterase
MKKTTLIVLLCAMNLCPSIYAAHHISLSSQATNIKGQVGEQQTIQESPALAQVANEKHDVADNKTWANYERYQSANKEVKKPIAVFMGNSITEIWNRNDSAFFNRNHYVGRGISGQVTAQMLARFRSDVINLKPQVVSILAGTNDIAQNNMYMPIEKIAENIFSMAELARANNIKVIICSVLPVYQYRWRPAIKDPAGQIIQLNNLLKTYAKEHKITYVDFHSVMKDSNNGLPLKYSEDGVHPTKDGFSIMEPIIKKAIDKLLK